MIYMSQEVVISAYAHKGRERRMRREENNKKWREGKREHTVVWGALTG